MSCRTFCALTLTAFLGTSTATDAQQSAAPATPAEPTREAVAVEAAAGAAQDSGDGFADKAKDWAERTQIIERLNGDVDGWYPRLGGMTRGGGFALGPGYRRHLGNVLVDLSAGLSTKTYVSADVKVRWFQAFDERIEFWTNYRYEDFPQEDFFGRGLASIRDNRTSYDFDSIDFSALGLFKPLPWLRFGTELGYMSPDVGEGTDSKYLSID